MGRRVRIRIRRKEKGVISPAVAFAVLVLVLAASLIGFALFERDDIDGRPAPSPAGSPTEEDLSLTDAEAIQRFKELDALRIQAYEQRDLAKARQVFLPSSPELQRAVGTIRRLTRDRVLMRHKPYDLLGAEVVRNTPTEIEISQVLLLDIVFIDEEGEDVTKEGHEENVTVRWTLRLYQGQWFIENGRVIKARRANA